MSPTRINEKDGTLSLSTGDDRLAGQQYDVFEPFSYPRSLSVIRPIA